MEPPRVTSPAVPPLMRSAGMAPVAAGAASRPGPLKPTHSRDKTQSRRLAAVGLMILCAFGAIAAQLVRLGFHGRPTVQSSMLAPLSQSWSRPDIVDRKGNLLATDVFAQSLFADPSVIVDLDEVVEQLNAAFPDMSEASLRSRLSDRARRFVWLRRGLAPRVAQKIHELGLPGIGFRRELHRIYPAGSIAGHILGHVDVDNKGIAGIERYIDNEIGIVAQHGAGRKHLTPVVLSLDLGVQHALHQELSGAIKRYGAKAAAGIILDVRTGEIIAAASLPEVDPAQPSQGLQPAFRNRLFAGTYELGSVFKTFTVAMALDSGNATLGKTYDVSAPLKLGNKQLRETHAPLRAITLRELFLYSSNVGAALIGLEAGPARQQAFWRRLGVLNQMRTEAGRVAKPVLPKRWGDIATATISYGHGLAVSPLQFAAASAALINGGFRIKPTFLPRIPQDGDEDDSVRQLGGAAGARVLSASTSADLREIMRLNVTAKHGTGRRAATRGYRVGGKTGTAEIATKAGYAKKSVVSSFLGAFPMDAPRYLTLVSLFEPTGAAGRRGQIAASVNAAPTTSRLVRRIAPMLGVYPRGH